MKWKKTNWVTVNLFAALQEKEGELQIADNYATKLKLLPGRKQANVSVRMA